MLSSTVLAFIALPAPLARHVLAEGYQATKRSHVPAAKSASAALKAYSQYHPDEPGSVLQVVIPSNTPQGAGGYRIPGQRIEPDRLTAYIEPEPELVQVSKPAALETPVKKTVRRKKAEAAVPKVEDMLNLDNPLVQQVLAENPVDGSEPVSSSDSDFASNTSTKGFGSGTGLSEQVWGSPTESSGDAPVVFEVTRYIVSTNIKKNWTLEQLQAFSKKCFHHTEDVARSEYAGIAVAVYKVVFEDLYNDGTLGKVLSAERLLSSGKTVKIE